MKKVLLIALAAVAALSITFTIGYSIGKVNGQSQSLVWIDETGETYFAR